VLPLQLGAWLFRGLVFQYVGLSSIGAYLKLYRATSATADGVVLDDRLQQVPVLDRPSAR
jgi:hypothetical protein